MTAAGVQFEEKIRTKNPTVRLPFFKIRLAIVGTCSSSVAILELF